MKKSIKDLTIMDKVYSLDVENNIRVVKVYELKENSITFYHCRKCFIDSLNRDRISTVLIDVIIFFNIEDLIDELINRKKRIYDAIKFWSEDL